MRIVHLASLMLGLAVAASAGSGEPAGALAGRPFAAKAVELRSLGLNTVKVGGKIEDKAQAYVLEFKGTDEFMPDASMEVWFTVDVGTSLQNLKLTCRPVKFGTDAYRQQHYKSGGSSVGRGISGVFYRLPSSGRSAISEHQNEEISAVVQFGKSQGGWIAGAIDLRLPADKKTYLRGSFTAKIAK